MVAFVSVVNRRVPSFLQGELREELCWGPLVISDIDLLLGNKSAGKKCRTVSLQFILVNIKRSTLCSRQVIKTSFSLKSVLVTTSHSGQVVQRSLTCLVKKNKLQGELESSCPLGCCHSYIRHSNPRSLKGIKHKHYTSWKMPFQQWVVWKESEAELQNNPQKCWPPLPARWRVWGPSLGLRLFSKLKKDKHSQQHNGPEKVQYILPHSRLLLTED
jgi:hypothetical protein